MIGGSLTAPAPLPPRYRFAAFTLSPAHRVLLRDGREVPVIPRYLDLLLLLVDEAAPGRPPQGDPRHGLERRRGLRRARSRRPCGRCAARSTTTRASPSSSAPSRATATSSSTRALRPRTTTGRCPLPRDAAHRLARAPGSSRTRWRGCSRPGRSTATSAARPRRGCTRSARHARSRRSTRGPDTRGRGRCCARRAGTWPGAGPVPILGAASAAAAPRRRSSGCACAARSAWPSTGRRRRRSARRCRPRCRRPRRPRARPRARARPPRPTCRWCSRCSAPLLGGAGRGGRRGRAVRGRGAGALLARALRSSSSAGVGGALVGGGAHALAQLDAARPVRPRPRADPRRPRGLGARRGHRPRLRAGDTRAPDARRAAGAARARRAGASPSSPAPWPALAGPALALGGRHLGALSLDLMARSFPGSQVGLAPLARLRRRARARAADRAWRSAPGRACCSRPARCTASCAGRAATE